MSTHVATEFQVTNAIAIVGLAGRFPGAADVDAFWRNVAGAVESIRPSRHRLGSPPDKYVDAVSNVDGVDLFDARFFGIAPTDAEAACG